MKQNARILVVDDEQDLLEILKFNLETEGYEVMTATSAEDALQLDIASFDLLLLDVMMGGMSGFAMARQLKDNPATAQVPIIFLTARDTENDTVTGFNLGADDYISKPFSLREVMVRVRAVLRRTAKENSEEEAKTLSRHCDEPRPQDGERRRRGHPLHQDRVRTSPSIARRAWPRVLAPGTHRAHLA